MHVVFVLANNTEAPYFNWFAKRATTESNYRMTFICMFPETPKMIEDVKKYGWDCFHISYDENKRKIGLIKSFFQLYKLFKKLKPDVVNTHLFDDSLPSLLAAKLAKVPARVITKGDTGFHYYYAPKWVKFDNLNNWAATDIIAISEQNKNLILEAEKINTDKLCMIHHGIPIKELTLHDDNIKRKIIDQYNLESCILIGNVSRLIEWKGQDQLILAAKEIIKHRQDVRFLLVGVGPNEANLKKMVKQFDLDQYFHFLGWVDRKEIPSFYDLLDIYCHTASKEPFGFVIAEALANGTPVISSDTGVAADVIINNENGFLYPEKDHQELAKSLLNLMSKNLSLISEQAANTALQKLDFEIMFKNYKNLYIKRLQYEKTD